MLREVSAIRSRVKIISPEGLPKFSEVDNTFFPHETHQIIILPCTLLWFYVVLKALGITWNGMDDDVRRAQSGLDSWTESGGFLQQIFKGKDLHFVEWMVGALSAFLQYLRGRIIMMKILSPSQPTPAATD
jgi:hypothetical protein